MTTALLPLPKARFFDASGAPLAGGKVYTYVAGTTTPKTSYTDSTGATPNANPVILDAAGEANIWLEGNYKIVLKNSSDVTQWTVDNVSGGAEVSIQWLTVTGTDTLVATPTSAVTAYQAQQIFLFYAAATNTTAVTINISGLGAKAITKNGTTPLVAGDIVANAIVQINYDGTQFQMQTVPAATYLNKATGGTVSALVTMSGAAFNEAAWVDVASATTTDIGAAASNNVRITGTTTITGFGTVSAGTRRMLRFAGALTLTHNATSLILPSGANIVTAANDTAVAISLGSGNWVVTEYQKANGLAVIESAGRLIGQQYFTTSGTATYTPTTGTSYVVVEVWGAGGSGGNSSTDLGTGGGAGGYSKKKITSSFSGVTVTVGAKGAAQASSNANGNNGGTSSFGAIISATGGNGGAFNDGFASGVDGNIASGGSGSGGDLNLSGGYGWKVGSAAASVGFSFGGDSPFLLGGGGRLINGGVVNGVAGLNPGGGGTGGYTAGANSSGAGADGMVIVWEYS